MLDNEQAGELIKHIIAYVNDENPVLDNQLLGIAFEPIKQHLKRDLKRWETQRQQRVDAGKASAEARKRNATTVNDRSLSSTVSVNGTVSGSVNENVIKEFVQFWNIYQKKSDKSKCEKKWKSLTDKERAEILEHAPKYVTATPDKQYRKNPLTYLNSKTWEDEDLPSVNGQSNVLTWKPNL